MTAVKGGHQLASIRFTADADGNLTPVTLELLRGDLFRLQSGDSTSKSDVIYAATGNFILTGISTGENGSMTLLDGSGAPALVRQLPKPDPTLPVPPPEDGNSVTTILIDQL
jgi:hypothetical protein